MFLLMYIGEAETFDVAGIDSGLLASQRVIALQSGAGNLFSYEYRLGDDFTIIRVRKDMESIMIDGMGEASLAAALDIQKLSEKPVRIIDDDYSFDLNLGDFTSTAELHTAIERASGIE